MSAWTYSSIKSAVLQIQKNPNLSGNIYFGYGNTVKELKLLDKHIFQHYPNAVLNMHPDDAKNYSDTQLNALLEMPHLKSLALTIKNKTPFPVISQLTQLDNLKLIFTRKLDIDCISSLSTLKELTLCGNVNSMDVIKNCINIQQLIIKRSKIENLDFLNALTHLNTFAIVNCDFSLLYPDFSNLLSLRNLSLLDNKNMLNIGFLENLSQLEYLEISSNHITRLPNLSQLTHLKKLVLNLKLLDSLLPVLEAPALEILDLAFMENKIIDGHEFLPISNMPLLKGIYWLEYGCGKRRGNLIKKLLSEAGTLNKFYFDWHKR